MSSAVLNGRLTIHADDDFRVVAIRLFTRGMSAQVRFCDPEVFADRATRLDAGLDRPPARKVQEVVTLRSAPSHGAARSEQHTAGGKE